jgi:hypothetical protein
MKLPDLDAESIDRIIEMAWEDRTPFALMRREMKSSSFRMWRERVTKRQTKHLEKREFIAGRFKSQNQKT